jgi:ABC-2 type transport system ATP-binding protein
LLEVRTAQPLAAALGEMEGLVQVVASGPDWVRYLADAPELVNPQVLAYLAGRRLPVVTLSEVPRSLEDVYLHVVEADADASAG